MLLTNANTFKILHKEKLTYIFKSGFIFTRNPISVITYLLKFQKKTRGTPFMGFFPDASNIKYNQIRLFA